MTQSYESYCADLRAQDVAPQSREAWERDCDLAKPHTVDFTVTKTMSQHGSLEPGRYRNHFGLNQQLIRTERLDH